MSLVSFLQRSTQRRGLIALVGVVWLSVVLGGMAWVSRYKATPGQAATAPTEWPPATPIAKSEGLPKLLLLAHPRCTCTRATLAELDKLVRAARVPLDLEIIFIRPEGVDDSFVKNGELWAKAVAIPGAKVSEDFHRVEARRFGAAVSGQVLLYRPNGELAFSGGITGSRGHEGANAGAERVLSLLQGKEALSAAPTFGCDLNDPNPSASGETR